MIPSSSSSSSSSSFLCPQRVQKLMEQDQNTWWEVMGKLQIMLRKAAQVLMMARKMDREQMHNYFMSGKTLK